MSTTEERAQMLYDKALTELNTYLEDMKTNRRRRLSTVPIKS